MRLILEFIFFGLLFYGLYLFAPDFFATLVSWAAALFEFIQDMVDKIQAGTQKKT